MPVQNGKALALIARSLSRRKTLAAGDWSGREFVVPSCFRQRKSCAVPSPCLLAVDKRFRIVMSLLDDDNNFPSRRHGKFPVYSTMNTIQSHGKIECILALIGCAFFLVFVSGSCSFHSPFLHVPQKCKRITIIVSRACYVTSGRDGADTECPVPPEPTRRDGSVSSSLICVDSTAVGGRMLYLGGQWSYLYECVKLSLH